MLWFGFRVPANEIEVVDGDTIWHLSGGERRRKYRLIGYDAPETYKAKTEHEHGWGIFAKEKLEEAIAGARRLKIRPTLFGDRWSYDARLARLLIDGKDVRDIAIAGGWGVLWVPGKRPKWAKLDD